MLGSSCSPCCGCSPEAANELWQTLKTKSCTVSATLNVPRGDPATAATFGYAAAQRFSDPAIAAAAAEHFTRNGYVPPYASPYAQQIPASASFYEGNAALSSFSHSLALDLSATSWNSQTSTGYVTFRHETSWYTVTLTLTISPGSPKCVVAGSVGVRVKHRVANSSEGAGMFGGIDTQNIVGLNSGGRPDERTCSLVSAPYYTLLTTNFYPAFTSANAGMSVGTETQLVYPYTIQGTYSPGTFCTVMAWWQEDKNTDPSRWFSSDILSSAFSVGSLTQSENQWSASGGWSGPFNSVPRQWKEVSQYSNLLAQQIWVTQISLASPYPNSDYRFATYGFPSGGVNSGGSIVACSAVSTSTQYAPATFDNATVSANVVLS